MKKYVILLVFSVITSCNFVSKGNLIWNNVELKYGSKINYTSQYTFLSHRSDGLRPGELLHFKTSLNGMPAQVFLGTDASQELEELYVHYDCADCDGWGSAEVEKKFYSGFSKPVHVKFLYREKSKGNKITDYLCIDSGFGLKVSNEVRQIIFSLRKLDCELEKTKFESSFI